MKWLVEYATSQWPTHYIVIHCDTRAEVRKILKKHIGSDDFKINKITKEDVTDES